VHDDAHVAAQLRRVLAARALATQLEGFLEDATVDTTRAPRALIVPHAGYSYSGATAAYGYKAVDPRHMCVSRVRQR
jgi:AmmeMemoRadiSam system protein B